MITLWFPTAIFNSYYQKHRELKEILLEKILNNVDYNPSTSSWIGNVPNSLNLWNPLNSNEEIILDFSKWIEEQADEFAFHYRTMNQYQIGDCWANVYNKGDFQESHYHQGWDFSAVYYIQCPENSGSIVFESPLLPDMRPIESFEKNELSCTTAIYPAEEGKLLIFRSNLRHGVYPHGNDIPRISLAMNLSKK